MKNILIVLPKLPYPLNSGGNQAVFHMIKAIMNHYHVYITFPMKKNLYETKILSEFEKQVGKCVNILPFHKKYRLNFYTINRIYYAILNKMIHNDIEFVHNREIWGQKDEYNLDFINHIDLLISKYNIDAIQVEFYELLHLVYALPKQIKRIFIHHELRYVRNSLIMNNYNNLNAYDKYKYNRLKAEEIIALNNYDYIISVSDIDKNKLINEGVSIPIFSSPFCIPQNKFPVFKPALNRLTFIAAGGHYPNVEGLNWFLTNIWKLVRNDIHLHIIGKWDENSKKTYCKKYERVHFEGYVEDLSLIVPSSIMIVPILSGSGMRMKILEAINNSVPFVTTSVGVEGLDFINNKDCYICDRADDFAEKINNLFLDKNLQETYVYNSRKTYNEKYSYKALTDRRLKTLKDII